MAQPRRLLFIASIGNMGPYRRTRHSAGHLLLDAIAPLLRARLAPSYTTWYSPSFMNESGPKLVRQLQRWLAAQDSGSGSGSAASDTALRGGTPATLVILHDELEAPLGKVRVKRGGPEVASLRGHRGLISAFESLRGKGLYPARELRARAQRGGKDAALPRDLAVLRVGVGIGRPPSREKNAVADYVLTAMEGPELEAVRRAAGPVVEVLEEEMCRDEHPPS